MLELEKVELGQLQTGEITERQAREILAAPEEKREEMFNKISETGKVPPARKLHGMRTVSGIWRVSHQAFWAPGPAVRNLFSKVNLAKLYI